MNIEGPNWIKRFDDFLKIYTGISTVNEIRLGLRGIVGLYLAYFFTREVRQLKRECKRAWNEHLRPKVAGGKRKFVSPRGYKRRLVEAFVAGVRSYFHDVWNFFDVRNWRHLFNDCAAVSRGVEFRAGQVQPHFWLQRLKIGANLSSDRKV